MKIVKDLSVIACLTCYSRSTSSNMGFRHLLVLTGFGLASQIDKRSCLPAIDFSPEIDYVGCHESSAESYALTGSMQHMSNNSPLNCAELCGRSGFTYAGLENELYVPSFDCLALLIV